LDFTDQPLETESEWPTLLPGILTETEDAAIWKHDVDYQKIERQKVNLSKPSSASFAVSTTYPHSEGGRWA